MLITRTPFRISFFGGGTDFKEYYDEFGGSVLSTSIDKYCYTTIRSLPPIFSYKSQLSYSKIERFSEVDEINHPLVRNALKFIPADRVQINYDADLPASSGIGSSSSFAVGLLQALHAIHNEYPDKMTLAKEAIHLERDLCGEAGGAQDQVIAAYGGINRINFYEDKIEVNPIITSERRLRALRENLMLVFTGFTHFSGEVSEEQKSRIKDNLPRLHEMKEMVGVAERILMDGDFDDFGRLLNHTWELKKTLSKIITNDEIECIYRKALENGAVGGKLLGAGSGGFMLLYVPKENQPGIKAALPSLRFVPFDFEKSGTQIMYEHND